MSDRQEQPALETGKGSREPPSSKRLLRFYFIFRLILAGLLAILFFADWGPYALLGSRDPKLFTVTILAYLLLIFIDDLLRRLRLITRENRIPLALFVDIIAITLLVHASGGVRTGLGMLLIVPIAAGSLASRGRMALLFAALATLAIITGQIYELLWYDSTSTSFVHAGLLGASFFAMAVLADVLSRRLLETEQLASQRQLDLANMAQLNEYIIQHMQTGILIVDEKARIRLWNESAWSLLGLPSMKPDQSLEKDCPELFNQLEAWSRTPNHEHHGFRATEGGRDLQANFVKLGARRRIGTLIFLEDSALVTQQAQQMKLASLGRLTASIAHEIRNPLGAISHAGQLLEESPSLSGGDQRLTEIIRGNSRRVNEVIENVLQLSRRSSPRAEEITLLKWAKGFAEEFRRDNELAASQLQLKITPPDTQIRFDPGQLRQILTSLCDNVLRHFEGDRERLRIRLDGGVTPESGGPFLEIIDNGPGIETENARHIFEPFFTTRNTGTGLGLYIAKELCEFNRARLEYSPGPAGGSCFCISFPNPRTKVFNP